MRKLALRDEILLQIDKAARYIGGEGQCSHEKQRGCRYPFCNGIPGCL